MNENQTAKEHSESLHEAAGRLLAKMDQRAKKQVAVVPVKDTAEITKIGARPCAGREGGAADGYARLPQDARHQGVGRRGLVLKACNDNRSDRTRVLSRYARPVLVPDFSAAPKIALVYAPGDWEW